MNQGTQKILSLIDIVGSETALKKYRTAVENTLPTGEEPKRYWSMYAQIMQAQIENQYVTDKKSIINCMFNAPKLGLNPDPVMGQIYFIPYKGKLTYQVGYKGMIALAHRAGIRVRAGLVYEKDAWKYFEDEHGQHFLWEPLLDVKNASERGREIFAFSVFTEASGVQQIHIMESYHIDQIKKLVLARMKGASTPWSDPLFEPEMRKKTCIRRHSKTEPFSVELARAIEHEENDEAGKDNKETLPELLEVFDAQENPVTSPEEAAKLNKELDLQAAKESGQA